MNYTLSLNFISTGNKMKRSARRFFFVHQTLLSIINFFVAQPSVQFSYGSLKNYIEEFSILFFTSISFFENYLYRLKTECRTLSIFDVCVYCELRAQIETWLVYRQLFLSTTERKEFFLSFFFNLIQFAGLG